MGKRGPKAANSRGSGRKQAQSAWLSPAGRGLGPAEQAEWNRRVKAKEPGFYREDDAGLLIQLCQAVTDRDDLRRQKAEALKVNDAKMALLCQTQWREQAKLVSMLSRQLKIGASARETHRATAKASRTGVPEARSVRAHLMFSGGDPWALENLASCCQRCHSQKTAAGERLKGCNADGTPRDPNHEWNP